MTREASGAQFEIKVDGVPRTYRDVREGGADPQSELASLHRTAQTEEVSELRQIERNQDPDGRQSTSNNRCPSTGNSRSGRSSASASPRRRWSDAACVSSAPCVWL